ncbi:MAG: hypothetical protein VYD34_04330 [Verrucomicrobiota bacterium]|nr:hypothetical protein [Verrucomicrobiota bacterium]
MDNKVKKAAFWNTMTALLGLLVGGAVVWSMTSGPAAGAEVEAATVGASPMAWLVAAFLLMGFAVALFSFFHLHLLHRETLEQLEHDELVGGKSDISMFEADAFPARRTREQFDKYVVPAFTIVLLLFQGFIAYPFFSGSLGEQMEANVALDQPTVVLALSAVFGLFLFLRGRYATLLSRKGDRVILQPGSDFLLLGSYLFFFQAVAAAGSMIEYKQLHLYVAYGFFILMTVLTFETLLRLILDIYRPRVEGREVRQLYHSRLVGLISKPEGFFNTAAQTLDYQFGFKVSETWGYRFLRDRLGMVVMLQMFVLWLSSSIVIIQPNEKGILHRGNEVLGPGINLKWPWPFDTIERFKPGEIRTLVLGPERDPERSLEAEAGREIADANQDGVISKDERARFLKRPFLWMDPDVKDYDLQGNRERMISYYYPTTPEQDSATQSQDTDAEVQARMLFGHIKIQFRIGEGNVKQWATQSANPEQVLEQIAEREISSYLLVNRVDGLLTTKRGTAEDDVLKNIQDEVRALNLGLEVLGVNLAALQPPAEPPVKQVISAQDKDKTKETGAESAADAFEGYSKEFLSQMVQIRDAKVVTESSLLEARTAADAQISVGQRKADSKRDSRDQENRVLVEFLNTYEKSKIVFPYYMYMEGFTRAVGKAERKWVIVGSNPQDRININFEKTGSGLGATIRKVTGGPSN